MNTERMNRIWLLGFLGFLGFLSVKYVFSGDTKDLVFISFFAYFAFFFMRKINPDMDGEMYYQHVLEASRFVLMIPLIGVFLIPFLILFFDISKIGIVFVSLAIWTGTLFIYAVKLNRLERG